MKPEEVFTPRAARVNERMYISRENLEKSLLNAIGSTQNIIIHGESGCGKSWLFKKVFRENKIPYLTVNMANISRFESLNGALEERFSKFKKFCETSSEEESNLSAEFLGLGGSIKDVKTIETLHADPFDRCLEIVSLKKKEGFIVFENLEWILKDESALRQISSTIILLDDEDYSKYKVRILLIGVPDDIQRYFQNNDYSQTISNRIVEIPEVERMSPNEAERLIRRGFEDLLNYKIQNQEIIKKDKFGKTQRIISFDVVKNIAWQADYIPQYIHELCLHISKRSSKNSVVDVASLRYGIYDWIRTSFTSDYGTVESKLNSRQTRAGRRNQVIFSLGRIGSLDFRANDVEDKVREFFSNPTKDVILNVNQIMIELSEGTNSLIKRTPKGDAYRFSSPKLKVCVRCMLDRSDDEKVVKIPIDQTFKPRTIS